MTSATATPKTPIYAIGQPVRVLSAVWLPKEHTKGVGAVERITYQSSNGEPLYWVKGQLAARTARVLRAVDCSQCDGYVLNATESPLCPSCAKAGH